MKYIHSILILFLFASTSLVAQNSAVLEAISKLKTKEFQAAKAKIDEAIKNETTSTEAKTWYYKGAIYKGLYKEHQASDPKSKYRAESVQAFYKAIELDKEEKYTENAKGSLKFLSSKYYNDAAIALQQEKFELSKQCFEEYKSIAEKLSISDDVKTKEIEYKLVLGTTFTNKYNNANEVDEKAKYLQKAKSSFEDVLKVEPKNLKANYNMGVLYYNEAVNIIKETDYDLDLFSLGEVEDNSVELFKRSLPYMETAFEVDPKNKNTIEGLAGIYDGLKEEAKFIEMQKKLEELE